MQALSMELFGLDISLPEFPRVKSLRGLGTSDSTQYALLLAEKFDYRNTFYDREPKFDIVRPPESEFGTYDFVISSEVLEHVEPPPERAFQNALRLLKPSGVLLLTVPYSLEPTMSEHFPDLHQYGFAQVGGRVVLVNRTRSGELQMFENPVFHSSWSGDALELREFSEADLKRMILGAGFNELSVYSEDYPPFGIVRSETWSLPIAARKGTLTLSRSASRDVLEEWVALRRRFDGEMRRLDRNLWYRIGRKLKLV
jgi:SAM-dependent methyltransferase